MKRGPPLDRFIGIEYAGGGSHAFSIKLSVRITLYVPTETKSLLALPSYTTLTCKPTLWTGSTPSPLLLSHQTYSQAWELNRALTGVVDPTLSLSLSPFAPAPLPVSTHTHASTHITLVATLLSNLFSSAC